MNEGYHTGIEEDTDREVNKMKTEDTTLIVVSSRLDIKVV